MWLRERDVLFFVSEVPIDIEWEQEALILFVILAGLMSNEQIEETKNYFSRLYGAVITAEVVKTSIRKAFVSVPHKANYFISKLSRTL